MNSKQIALTVVFTALAAFLNLSPIKIPAPYAPFLIYQLWEIPIVAVSMLFGLTMGVVVAILNTMILFVVYPGALPTGPIYNLAAVLSMLIGVYISRGFVKGLRGDLLGAVSVVLMTGLGVVFRVITMTVVNWVCLPLPPPIGFSFPSDMAFGLLPVIGIFNASIVLYTVPLGSALVKAIRLRISEI